MSFLSFKQETIDKFKYLYPDTDNTNSEERQNTNYTAESQFSEEFGWYNLVFVAANEDYVKINKVLQSNAIEFLMYVNYYIKKQDLEKRRLKR